MYVNYPILYQLLTKTTKHENRNSLNISRKRAITIHKHKEIFVDSSNHFAQFGTCFMPCDKKYLVKNITIMSF